MSLLAAILSKLQQIQTTVTQATNSIGDGSDGDVVISADTYLANGQSSKQYNNLTINAGYNLTSNGTVLIVKVKDTATINGTLHMNAKATAPAAYVASSLVAVDGVKGPMHLSHLEISSTARDLNAYGDHGDTSAHKGGYGGKASGMLYDILKSTPTDTLINGGLYMLGGSGGNGIGCSDSPPPYYTPYWIIAGHGETGVGGGGGAGSHYTYSSANGLQGGRGGGTLILLANNLVIGATGLVAAKGEQGTDSTVGYASGAGGGGGGLLIVGYKNLSVTSPGGFNASGGDGGLGYNPAAARSAGGQLTTLNGAPTDGVDGSNLVNYDANGGGGASGIIIARTL